MPQLVASLEERRTDHGVHRQLRLSGGRPGPFFAFEGDLLPRPDPRLDFAALALVFPAMVAGEDLHLAGPVSSRLLDNLQEFQHHWQDHTRGRLKPVRVTAEEETADPAPPPRQGDRAVLAFSGGVDATATLIRQVEGRAGRWTRSVIGAVMAHGFDIPLAQEERFARAAARARDTLAAFDVPLTVVRTDFRAGTPDWVVMHSAGLGALLHQFRGHVSTGLIAYDQHHARFQFNHASNSAVNPLFSGHDFDIRSDAAELERIEKIALIANHPRALANLRVCWMPDTGGRLNCGACEKCVRTRAVLEALEVPHRPEGLEAPVGLRDLFGRRGRARSENQIDYIRQAAELRRDRADPPPWARAVDLAATHARVRLRLARLRRALSGRRPA